MVKVSLVKGENRRENIKRSLDIISEDIQRGLKSGHVIIKPNFVSTSVQLAASHVDQIKGILDYLRGFYKEKIIIAEAAAGDTAEGFKNFNYHQLHEEYNVELADLNKGPFEKIPILNKTGEIVHVRISHLLLDRNNYLISAAKLKTHDSVVITLAIKNVVMGSIYVADKTLVHQGYRQINRNIADLARLVWPDLSVIDGFVGMEGEGPVDGSPVDVGIAISSIDPLAADRVASEVMGVDFNKVGYLYHCSKRAWESQIWKRLKSEDMA